MNKQELQDKIYSMSNSFLPLDVFFNDIRDNTADNYNKEQAYKDIEIIADFIIDLQSQLDQQKARIEELEGQFAYECECNKQFVQLQKMWDELKEWLNKKSKILDKSYIARCSSKDSVLIDKWYRGMISKEVLKKMQDLEEKGEKNGNIK